MALPKINSTPSYQVTVPSSGQTVSFRPFLVKEQKTLLIALETQDRKDMVRAIIRTIESCVEDALEGELTTFDVDYLFTKIRAKSVGETSELVVTCNECEAKNDVTLELDKVEIGDVSDSKIIELTDTMTLEMRFPTYDDLLGNPRIYESTSVTESLVELVVSCMDKIKTEEELYVVRDETPEEITAFVESMNADQFEKVANFVNTIPTIQSVVDFNCIKCGAEQSKTFEGIDDFF